MLVFDMLWKLLHFISTVVLISAAALWLIQILAEYEWQGPELTPSNPILLAMALADLWVRYSGTLAWVIIGLILGAVGLWIVFEALFRGGFQRFWIYAGTRLAFLTIMLSAMILLTTLTAHDGLQGAILTMIVLLGLWWIVSVGETLVRRDAVELLATNLTAVSGALGSLLAVQLILTVSSLAIISFSAMMMFQSSSAAQFLAAAFLMATALLFWTIVHSYLVVVRYSTIDIMRGNVVEL